MITQGYFAEFASAEELLRAARAMRERGLVGLDAYSPYPVHGLEHAIGMSRPTLQWPVLPIALGGALFAYIVQWWTTAIDYPLNVGGRPLLAGPAWVPIIFETTVLFASLSAFGILLWKLGLLAPWHPVFELPGFERASIDRFWLAVDRADPRFDRDATLDALESLSPLQVVFLDTDRKSTLHDHDREGEA